MSNNAQLVVRNALEDLIQLVLDSVSSPISKHLYRSSLVHFLAWLGNRGSQFSKAEVQAYKSELEGKGLSSSTVNLRLAAIRKLAVESSDAGLLHPFIAAAIGRVKECDGKAGGSATGLPRNRHRSC